jgi:Ca2+-binding EF-hand superfamily protein
MGNSKGKEKVPEKLSKRDIKAIVKQTGLTEQKVQDLFDNFMSINQTGQIDINEFTKLYQALRKEPVDNLEAVTEFCFRAFDSNNNGYLTFKDFVIGYGLTTEGNPADKLDYAFDIYDADSDGYLTSAELKNGLTAMLDLMGADKAKYNINELASECIQLLDTSKDGKVSKEEFITGLLKNYRLRVLMSPFN